MTGDHRPERENRVSRHHAGPDQSRPERSGPRRLYRSIGYASLVLATIGAALPVLPTVPFLLVAAWAFARSDPRLLERVYRDRRFGPLLRQWQAERAIPTRAKVVAVLMMAGSWTLIAVSASNPLLPAGLGVVLAAVALYVISRPAPKATAPSRDRPASRPDR